ncbi:hypothetical protein HYS97_02065 [Candidatus Daviesbacteria bacterium]|nr:hypothetical protein [Candidatus Daviesbacteria bacterium]
MANGAAQGSYRSYTNPSSEETLSSSQSGGYSNKSTLQESSASWTAWLTQNIQIVRADVIPSQNVQVVPENHKQKIDEALKIIYAAQGKEYIPTKTQEIIQNPNSSKFENSKFEARGGIVFAKPEGDSITFSFNEETKTTHEPHEAILDLKPQLEDQTEEKTNIVEKLIKSSYFKGISQALEEVLSFSKNFFGSIFELVNESYKRPLTAEEQKAKEENEKKEKEKTENKKRFFELLKEALAKYREQVRLERDANRERLGISGLDIASVNKFLSGERTMRNLNFSDVSDEYHEEFTAIGMIEKRKADLEKEKKAKTVKASGKKPSKKGPNVDFNLEKAGSSDNQVTKLIG